MLFALSWLVLTLLTNPTYTSTCKGRRYDYFTITDSKDASFALALGGKSNNLRDQFYNIKFP